MVSRGNGQSYGVHWFRRDLRVAGNPALQKHWQARQGRVLGLFVFDPSFLSRPDFSASRFAFFLESLKALKQELAERGSDLLVFDQGPQQAFPELWRLLDDDDRPVSVSYNRDYEPFARNRDSSMQKWFDQEGLEVFRERDHLIIEPHELHKKDSSEGYQVFTPFSRVWLSHYQSLPGIGERIASQEKGLEDLRGKLSGKAYAKTFKNLGDTDWGKLLGKKTRKRVECLEAYIKENSSKVTIPIPKAGSLAAFEQLQSFQPKLSAYQDQRDFPAVKGTSQLSHFLKNGSLTTSQIIAHLRLRPYKKASDSGEACYLSELIWREFYYHVLYRRPEVENSSFQPKYRDITWQNREDWFAAWCSGKTGFPIVDAAMRQLNTTGWMHNRLRMIVASFLCKDLLIDWRWGERYFMEKLLDGDLAPNNGGWQWAASTGCDAQPYFRIFNPYSQSKKFDSSGTFIQDYLPELKKSGLNQKELHQPQQPERIGYVKPIVDHAEQRQKALTLYKAQG